MCRNLTVFIQNGIHELHKAGTRVKLKRFRCKKFQGVSGRKAELEFYQLKKEVGCGAC